MITLEPGDYWQLRARAADVGAAQAALDAAREKQRHAFTAIAPKYQLDGQARYRFEDDRCALIREADVTNGGT